MNDREKLFFAEHGMQVKVTGTETAPAIVLIHGSGCDGSLWDALTRELAPKLRVVAVDLPGHGGSAPRPGGDTMKNYTDAVVGVIKALSLKHPVLGGHSLGGAVAMTAVLDNPGLAGSLVLVGSGARLRVLPAIIEALKNDFEGAVQNASRFSFGPDAGPEAVASAQEMMRRNGRDAMLADFLACDAFDVMTRLSEIGIPTLAVCGEADSLTPPKYSRFLADRINGCRIKTIPDAGHMVMLEAPGALAEAILEFATLPEVHEEVLKA